MLRRNLIAALVGAACAVAMAPLGAQQQEQTWSPEKAQTRAQEQIYGSQLMTQQERNEYRARMRAAKTVEERERIRAEHHEQMKVRAQEQGVALPDQPPTQRGHMGRGQVGGMGPGGGGMGPGGGGGRGCRGSAGTCRCPVAF